MKQRFNAVLASFAVLQSLIYCNALLLWAAVMRQSPEIYFNFLAGVKVCFPSPEEQKNN